MADLVPEEAIEALARAWFEAESATRFAKPLPWDSVLLAKARERQREWARAALEAAAPLIVAAELDRMVRAIDNAPYPYEVLEQRVAELRASVLRGEGDGGE